MRTFGRILAALAVIVLCAFPAAFAAGGMADAGWLGTCFEGACGYAAVFFVFPLLWIGLSVVAVILLWRMAWRAPPG